MGCAVASSVIAGSGRSSATVSTWSMVSTKCIFIAVRRFSGTSATSFSLSCGRITSNRSGAMRRQQLFFQSADGQYLAAQRNLAGHGDIAPDGNLAQSAGNRGGDGDAGRRAIFRNRAFRHVHVDIESAIEVARQAQAMGARADIGHGRLRRFLHHVAQFAGQREFAFAVNYGGFGAQNRAADFGPGQAGDQTDFAVLVGQRVAEFDHAQEVVDVVLPDGDVVGLAFLHYLARHFAADVADFALQVADARFPRVGADQGSDRVIGELDVLVGQARLQQLLLDQELLGDFDLFRLGVPVQAQHFHAVLQRGGMVCMTLAVAIKKTCDRSYSTSR